MKFCKIHKIIKSDLLTFKIEISKLVKVKYFDFRKLMKST